MLAQDEARRLQHNYLGTEHLLLGLLGVPDGVAAGVFGRLAARRADRATRTAPAGICMPHRRIAIRQRTGPRYPAVGASNSISTVTSSRSRSAPRNALYGLTPNADWRTVAVAR